MAASAAGGVGPEPGTRLVRLAGQVHGAGDLSLLEVDLFWVQDGSRWYVHGIDC